MVQDRTSGRFARRGWVRRGAILSALLVLSVGMTACGDDDDDAAVDDDAAEVSSTELLGEEDQASGDPVKIGMISDGASAAIDFSVDLRVADATVQFLNEHRGGIAGRPIELVTCETRADPGRAVDCGNQMVEDDVAAVVIGVSAVAGASWEPLHAAGVPLMIFQVSSPEILTDPDSSFVVLNPLAGAVATPVQAARDVDGEKVSVMIIDTPTGRSSYGEFIAQLFEAAGVELEVFFVPLDAPDLAQQTEAVVAGDPDVVHVLGTEAFCIGVFRALGSAGYEGTISSSTASSCVGTDAVREGVPTDVLAGMKVDSGAPLGATDDPSYQLWQAVVDEYGSDDIDVSDSTAMGAYITISALATALEDMTGEISPATVISTLKAMPEKELPGGGGMAYRCDGSASPVFAAVCSANALVGTVGDDGHITQYDVIDLAAILGGG